MQPSTLPPSKGPYPKNAVLKIDWVNTLFLTLTPIIAIAGASYLLSQHGIAWQTIVLSIALMAASGLGITAGYHRLFAHKSYETAWLIRLGILLFGAAAFQNSARKWCSDHRHHHQNVDRDGDPYNINKGFWHAHIGWIFYRSEPAPTYDNVPDLMADPLIRFQDRHYLLLSTLTGLALPMALASLWGDPWGGLVFGGFVRLVLNHHFTFAINSFCHFMGNQPYSDKNSARDSWILAFFTYGEGYHNFHHAFQSDYRNGIRAYHWDPTKWFILALARLGLAGQLRKTPEERILKARLRMDEIRLVQRVKSGAFAGRPVTAELIQAARLRLEEAHVKFAALKEEYHRLKREKIDSMHEKIHQMSEQVHRFRETHNYALAKARVQAELKKAKSSLDEAMLSWGRLHAELGC